jgi:polar amino acid transport system substrate-binding protein
MIAGIALSGIFIGHITTMMTVERLDSQISGLDDLRGEKVATVRDTTSAKLLERSSVRLVPVDDFKAACRLLEKGKVKAVVFDSPPLQHYIKSAGAGRAALVGPVLHREYYGIALPPRSPWREPVNRALTKLRRNGVYDALYGKWFGTP